MFILPVVAVMAFTGCKSGACSHKGHAAEGHEHAVEEAHGHEGHDHETEAAEENGHSDEIIFTRAQAEAAGLTVETVEPGVFSQVIRTSGRVESPQGEEVVIAATSGGIVSFAGNFTEGAAVSRGQAIVTISAQSIVDGDAATKARIEYEAAEREYSRAEELIKDQIISERDFNEARRRYETARAALPVEATAAGVRVASPLSGYIKNRLVASGQYVSVGQPIATIATNGKLQLRAEVSERWFGVLTSITAANFKTSYGETVYHTDRLLSYGRAAEGAYIPVTFEFANVGDVVPGAYVEVWLSGVPMPDVISVPKTALTEQQGVYFVYVQLDEEGYQKREVAIGPDNGERVRISSGLKPGDKVVTRGATQVRLAAMSGVIPEGHTH